MACVVAALSRLRLLLPLRPPQQHLLHRALHTTAITLQPKPFPPRLRLDENDLTENFIKGGGKGGQKINKTSSKVQLIHRPTGIQVNCQETRSRAQNRTLARRLLAERVEESVMGVEARTVVKGEERKRKARSAVRKRRRKYRALEEEAREGMSEENVANEDQGEIVEECEEGQGRDEGGRAAEGR